MIPARLIFLLVVCAAFSVHGAGLPVSSKSEIKDSGYVGRVQAMQDVYWVDNEQVLFLGWKAGDEVVGEDGQIVPKDGIHVWNIKTGTILAVDAQVSKVQSVCFQSAFTWRNSPKGDLLTTQGYLRYVFGRGNSLYVGFGALYRSRIRELDGHALKEGSLAVSPLSCREFNPNQLKKRYGGNPLPLLEPGEYLDRTVQDPSRAPAFLRYFPSDGGEAVVLKAIPTMEVVTTPRFSEYTQKYVFRELRRNTGPDSPMRMWMVDRTGTVEQTFLPSGPWMSGSPEAMPTRKGWFLTSTAVARASPGDGGGYLISGARVSRLIAGWPRSYSISPDGCKVAISISAHDASVVSAPTIGMINLCSKGD